MSCLKFFRFQLFVFILLFILNGAFCQQSKIDYSLQDEYLSIDSLIHKFGQKNSLRIYYKSEWFENKKLHQTALDLPLYEFISKLKSVYSCTALIIDPYTIVLVPLEMLLDPFVDSDKGQIIYIGKMQEYGKYSRARVTGKVLNGRTGSPLVGASIYFEQIKAGVTTDNNGRFSIELPVGREYDLKMKYMGFEEDSRKIKVLSSGNLELKLFEKAISLNEVVILANRAEQNISRTQMSVLTLNPKTIRELPVTLGEIDIIKSVSLLPGIQSAGEFGSGFFVRGGNSDQNLILIEDVPIFNSSHLFGLISILNPDGVSSVTLLKSGIPAKYGERASSVMDIRMRSDNQENTKVKGGVGLINSRFSLDIPLAKNKINLYIGGRVSYSDWLLQKIPDVDLMNSSAKFIDLNSLVSYNVNTRNRINFFGYYSNDEFGFTQNTKYKYGNALGSVHWNHTFNNNLSSVLTSGISYYNYNTNELDIFNPTQAYKSKASVFYKNLKYNIVWTPLQSNSIDMGFNAIHYSISPGKLSAYNEESNVTPEDIPKEQAFEYAIYAGDNITFSDKLSSEIGIRYSGFLNVGPGSVFVYDNAYPRSVSHITDTLYYKKNQVIKRYSGIEPRFSLRYILNENSSVKLSYSRNIQYINLLSNTTVANPSDVWKLSNNYIKPLNIQQFAIGYFRNFKNNTYETSVELYYKKLRNIIEYKNGATIYLNPTLDADLIDAEGYNYGIELYAKKSLGRLTGWLSYSYSLARRRTTSLNINEQVNNNNYFPSSFDRPHNLNIIGNYHISRRWRFSWTFMYNTGRPFTPPEYQYKYKGNLVLYFSDRNKYRLPDYHRLDISLSLDETLKIKKFWKGSWTLSVVNVYGRKNAYSVFYYKIIPSQENNFMQSGLYKIYIIGRPLPTLTYNFSF
jgi:hypothetical protein